MQRTTITAIIAFIVILIVVLGYIARPGAKTQIITDSENMPSANANTAAALAAAETRFDFGSISMAKGKVSHRFSFSNTSSTTPVVATKLYTSCMCTEASLMMDGMLVKGPFGMPGHSLAPSFNEIIAPGAVGEIEVVFDPAAHGPSGVGKIEREIRLESKNSVPLVFSFVAVVTP